MKNIFFSIMSLFGISSCNSQELTEKSVHDFTMTNIKGEAVSLSKYKGKTLLIVNVASKCGLTPQYKDLEELYQKYRDSGLEIIGFPANNFLWQEPGTNEEIAEFCQKNYGVSFDMYSKISVKGKDKHPLYVFLTEKKYNGLSDKGVSWNFQKFLVNKEGKLIHVFSPKEGVLEPENLSIIQNNL